jgi:hypothetical protein
LEWGFDNDAKCKSRISYWIQIHFEISSYFSLLICNNIPVNYCEYKTEIRILYL